MSDENRFPVLAKSEPEITLKQHIDDCLEIFRQLQLCFPNLPLADRESFWKWVYVAIVMHDIGKIHRDFQYLLRGQKNAWHLQRHELFSLYFLERLEAAEREKELIALAVTGHHKELDELSDYVRKNYLSASQGGIWEDFEDNDRMDFCRESEKIDRVFVDGLLSIYSIVGGKDWDVKFDISERLRILKKSRAVGWDTAFLEQLLLVGALKQCDHLASAGVKSLEHLELKDFDFLSGYSWYTHQQNAMEIVGNAILCAPTGSGKTETALLWLRKQLEVRGQGRVFYILPFTASINAMYERLNDNFGIKNKKVGMVHGKLAQYLEHQMTDDDALDVADKKRLLEDFRSLVTPFKVVTPFQLLKHLFGLKGFEKGMFEWSGCYLIFDEIHAYDPKVFAQIIVLLKFMVHNMHATVHIMTATLPHFMRKELEGVLGKFVKIEASPELYEKFKRHRVLLKPGRLENATKEIQKRLDEGTKVLVVCNTVAIAQDVYRRLDAERKVLLHGAFNGHDRNIQEQGLREREANLLVGTQAIEVSLDIDYDCIYTEPAPLDALLQRFGRVNRKMKKGVCDCCVFEERNDADEFIYTDAKVIDRTLNLLRKIILEDGGEVKEEKMQKAIDEVYEKWNEESKADYDLVLNLLEYEVAHNLSPLKYIEQREEEFVRQFSGRQVLPIELKGRYQKLLDENQFIKAESLLVNINEKRFAALIGRQQIVKERLVFESGKSGKIYDKNVYLLKRKYSSELGLLINEAVTVDDDCFI